MAEKTNPNGPGLFDVDVSESPWLEVKPWLAVKNAFWALLDHQEKGKGNTIERSELEDLWRQFIAKLGLGNVARDEDYERWSIDQIMMSIAYVSARGSHDSNTQHACVIVDAKNHIVSTGFNGFLRKSSDSILPNTRTGGFKYAYIIHAEANACAAATRADLTGCRAYVTGRPCNQCLTTLINRGIREIIIGDIGHVVEDGYWEMHYLLVSMHGVTIRKYSGEIVDTSKTRTIGN